MIKGIIFDCFGVLATDIWLAFCDSLPETADLQRASDLNKAYDRGMISHEAFVSGVREATGQEPPDIEQLHAGQLAKNEALLDEIKTLKGHYKIGLLSNISSDWVVRELLTADDQALFTAMVFSYEVGMTKPDPRIYQLTCERLGVAANEAVMIDDRPDYVEAAKREGLKGLVYTDLSTFRSELAQLLNTDK